MRVLALHSSYLRSFTRARAFLLSGYIRVRMWLWGSPLALPLPPMVGWKERIRAIPTDGSPYVTMPAHGLPGLMGAAPEWSLLRVNAEGTAWESYGAVCAVSGVAITGSPFTGVRCARCGVPLHVLQSGMRLSTDVPGCIPCRHYIRTIQRENL